MEDGIDRPAPTEQSRFLENSSNQLRGTCTVKIICDVCGAERPEELPVGVEWILGSDLEMEGRRGLQHSIRFLDHWNDARILELGAIHLCSTKCRDRYMKESKAA